MIKPKVFVIGAGFSGLSSAYFLHKAGFEVEIFETNSAPGGLIATKKVNFGLVETAANGIVNSEKIEELFNFANCEMIPTKQEARARFIMREKPSRWPLGFIETLAMLRFLFLYLFFSKNVSPKEFETIAQWGARVLTKDVSHFTIETALQGIYAGNPSKMSASLILGALFSKRQKQRLKFRGTVSAAGGMGEFIQKLASSLQSNGVKINYNQAIANFEKIGRPVVIATNSEKASELLKNIDPERANAVSQVELLPIVTVTAAFPQEDLKHKGFGCLFPPHSSRALGVLMNNYIFDGRATDALSETWIFGGAEFSGNRREQIIGLTDGDLIEMIVLERKRTFGSDARPLSAEVTRWPKALPHYTVELEKNIETIKRDQKQIFLIGNYTGTIGLTKIVEQASQLPARIGDHK